MNDTDNKQMLNDIQNKMKEEDWDEEFKKELGLESESASQTTSTPNELNNNTRSMLCLEEVIEEVIQEALEYADAPEEKRVLPALIRKQTKPKPAKTPTNVMCQSGGGVIPNNGLSNNQSQVQVTNFNAPQPPQPSPVSTTTGQIGAINNNNAGLLMSAGMGACNNINNSNAAAGFHPLVQANLTQANMQQMLQLAAASGKNPAGIQLAGGVSQAGNNGNQQTNTLQQQHAAQQQLTNSMMGFNAGQLPNVIMPPSYNAGSYNQQLQSGTAQYQIPVSLSQIQLAQQQSQHLLLGGGAAGGVNSFADLSATGANSSANQQQNSQAQQQAQSQHSLQAAFNTNSNGGPPITSSNNSQQNNPAAVAAAAISMSPYQLPGMIQAYAPPPTLQHDQQQQQQQQSDDPLNLNGSVGNQNGAANSAGANFPNSKSSNTTNTTTAQQQQQQQQQHLSVASLYPNAAFDLQHSHIYAQQRILQQHQQSQQITNPGGLFPDYAAVMARYSAYH